MTYSAVRSLLTALFCTMLFTSIGCTPHVEGAAGATPTSSAATSTEPAAAIPSLDPPAQVHLYYVLYLADQADHLRPLLGTILAKEGSELGLLDSPSQRFEMAATLWVDDGPTVIADAPPPDAQALRYLGKDLRAEQIDRVASARHAILLRFEHPAAAARAALARADRISLALAESLDAFIADQEARSVYSAASWKALRFAADGSARTDVLAQVNVHSYRDGELIRAVSLGMQKFALPDLVMDGLSQSTGGPLVWIMIGIQQRMVEGQRPEAGGAFGFDVRAIADDQDRNALKEGAFPNAAWQGRFGLLPTTPQDGDADNALLAVTFEHFEGPDAHAQRATAAGQVLGWSDEIKMIRHDEELELAS